MRSPRQPLLLKSATAGYDCPVDRRQNPVPPDVRAAPTEDPGHQMTTFVRSDHAETATLRHALAFACLCPAPQPQPRGLA